MAQARQLVKLVPQEFLIALRAGHRHLDQVVVFAGQQVGLHHLGQFRQRLAEAVQHVVVVPLQRDFDQHSVRQAQRLLVQQRGVAFDHPAFLQRAHAVPARRGRQAHLLRQSRIGQAAVAPQFAQDAAIGLIEFGRLCHSTLPLRNILPLILSNEDGFTDIDADMEKIKKPILRHGC
ncbi:hypothetical protein CBM2605_B110201 [Cupriavidus neocaledonicus]|uniref:Uncharacterized protein n=1 Tax=Cupriavidus neocaledonicus TaxID=1040979 RepID=A0ABY1V7S0_9BURK|nr:hypothetical protein CBM2605_B110201 [Cupriavidus neocaledonicus]